MATHVPQLAARGVTKSFGGRAILRGADLDVEASSRIGVLGPNGGGKSTLLRIIAGLEHTDTGNVTSRRGLVLAYLPQIVDGDERDGPPAALLDGSDQVLRFPGADVNRGCHLSSSGAAGSIVLYPATGDAS